MTTSYQDFIKSSQLSGANVDYLENLYEDYLEDPNSVSPEFQKYFGKLSGSQENISLNPIRSYFTTLAKLPVTAVTEPFLQVDKQDNVNALINDYRVLGHRRAKLDPTDFVSAIKIPELELSNHGLSEADLETVFNATGLGHLTQASLKEILAALNKTYCGSIGIEFMHITNTEERRWLLQCYEANLGQGVFSKAEKLKILDRLMMAEGLERYLHTKYVGQKRFSLEGGDTFIPLMNYFIELSAAAKADEVLIGMAHRGRLNVMINILGVPPKELFAKFEGKYSDEISGDVKYHLGFSSDVQTDEGPIHLSLAFNPSHLEIVSPVVEGSVRAKQDRYPESAVNRILPILVHGDASFAGQGVVMETFNLSQVQGYKTGGTVHIVINNQVGFTTDPIDDRSTLYCTDIAKMLEVPIFHVNGDDPEAALFTMQLAFEYRMKFNKDVVIDLVCYRRHGHNEADEPAATQPLLYALIKKMATPWAKYTEKLVAEHLLTLEDAQSLMKQYQEKLAQGEPVVKLASSIKTPAKVDWNPYLKSQLSDATKTGFDKEKLIALAKKVSSVPQGYLLHPRIEKIMQARQEMAAGKIELDWGFAETLAYATLLVEGHNIRLSGQDVQRGTFFHRHAVLHNVETGEKYVPLSELAKAQGHFEAFNSILSEEAVMAFDTGYAMAAPNDLIIWEAQFGDFANGAQAVVDQFLSSSEQKWAHFCGLTLLLPHGQEGQGPEHSSARLERYLQLCAQDNMQVCQPTTPAQIFHLLRRQIVRLARKPLIVFTPKSMLRHKLAISNFDELAAMEFQLLIPEVDELTKAKIRKVIVCSGKVYYDLLQKRRDNKQTDVAIIRLEQLYPFPVKELSEQLKSYTNAQSIVWCQEEPKNQGPWYVIKSNLEEALSKDHTLSYVGRESSAAPACGYLNVFTKEQEKLVEQALLL